MNQRTIKEAFSIKGKGLHTSLSAIITFRPAPVDSGYQIKRIDLEGTPVIRACAANIGNNLFAREIVKDIRLKSDSILQRESSVSNHLPL